MSPPAARLGPPALPCCRCRRAPPPPAPPGMCGKRRSLPCPQPRCGGGPPRLPGRVPIGGECRESVCVCWGGGGGGQEKRRTGYLQQTGMAHTSSRCAPCMQRHTTQGENPRRDSTRGNGLACAPPPTLPGVSELHLGRAASHLVLLVGHLRAHVNARQPAAVTGVRVVPAYQVLLAARGL